MRRSAERLGDSIDRLPQPILIGQRTSEGWSCSGDMAARIGDAHQTVFAAWRADRAGVSIENDRYGVRPFLIRAIPPSASLEWSDAGPAITSGWVAPKPALLSRAEAIERFGDTFTGAVEGRIQSDNTERSVLLSGGVDLRHILLALHEFHRLPANVVTVRPYPPAAADDVEIARQNGPHGRRATHRAGTANWVACAS